VNNSNTPTTPAPALLIAAKATCTTLSIGERRLWELTNCGAIPSFKIGKSRRYCPDELRAWIRAGCPTEPGAGDRVRKAVKP
jgi:predicted DNA-binding transcriptional regulator AlpA